VTTHGQSFAPPASREFFYSPEETYGAIAEYYDATWLSFRNAFWRLGNLHAEGYNASDFFVAGRPACTAPAHRCCPSPQVLGCLHTSAGALE
jgi:hypothetical protein